mgnify:FL=1
MVDSYARAITYLRISITDRCNYRCRYCMPDAGIEKCAHGDICSLEELRDMAAAAVRCGVRKIRVTGGEPLVRRGAVDFCRMLAEIPGVEELCVTTNGSLLAEQAAALREAGVTHLNISLDTLKEERFRTITRLGTLSDVLRGIKAAERAGFEKIKLNCVLLGGVNDDEIADFAALTRAHDWQVRFIERMPMGCGRDFGAYLPAQAALERCPELEAISHDGVAACYRFPGAKGTVGLIAPMSHAFCSECSRVRITADGKLKPCLHSAAELSLRGLSGDELEAAIRRGILMKPERHHMDETGETEAQRGMFAIGG